MPDNTEFMEELLNRQSADPMRTALVAIQELHSSEAGYFCDECSQDNGPYEPSSDVDWPCRTRKLADEGLGGEERG